MLVESRIYSKRPILMIGMLGSCPSKSYPIEYLARVIDAITENFEMTLLLNYLPHQKDKLYDLLSLCSKKSKKAIRADIFCPDLRSFIALLSICDGYVGNEGGSSNISKAVGIPNYSIFSPWISKKAWLTFGEQYANQGVHLEDFKPEIAKMNKSTRKKNTQILYEQFYPELFLEHLLNFIKLQILPDQ